MIRIYVVICNRVKIVSIEDPSKTCINLADINITGWYTTGSVRLVLKKKLSAQYWIYILV